VGRDRGGGGWRGKMTQCMHIWIYE
jgi:hypothetical protein